MHDGTRTRSRCQSVAGAPWGRAHRQREERSMAGTTFPTTNIALADQDFINDPSPTLHAIQELGPLVYHEGLDQYLVSRYRDCARVLGNARGFYSDNPFRNNLLNLDVDRHERVRSIWAEAFSRTGVERQRQMVAEVIDAQMGPFVERVRSGEVAEAVDGMIRAIPLLVIARMLGIPESDEAQLTAWSDDIGLLHEAATDPTPAGQEKLRRGTEASDALNAYLLDI